MSAVWPLSLETSAVRLAGVAIPGETPRRRGSVGQPAGATMPTPPYQFIAIARTIPAAPMGKR